MKNWKTLLREKGIPDHLILSDHLSDIRQISDLISDHLSPEKPVSQEATERTLYGIADWFKMEKGLRQGFCCHHLFNLYTDRILRNAGLDELQAGIKTGRRNTNNLRYSDDTTLMAESEEEELQSLWMRVNEENERAGLRVNIKKKLRSKCLPLLHHGK